MNRLSNIKIVIFAGRCELRDCDSRTVGRCASSRCTIGLTGVACVLLTRHGPVRVTPFFSLHRGLFSFAFSFLSACASPRILADIARCDVTRGGVIGYTKCKPTHDSRCVRMCTCYETSQILF